MTYKEKQTLLEETNVLHMQMIKGLCTNDPDQCFRHP
jgi:hypothetical protein